MEYEFWSFFLVLFVRMKKILFKPWNAMAISSYYIHIPFECKTSVSQNVRILSILLRCSYTDILVHTFRINGSNGLRRQWCEMEGEIYFRVCWDLSQRPINLWAGIYIYIYIYILKKFLIYCLCSKKLIYHWIVRMQALMSTIKHWLEVMLCSVARAEV